MQRRAARPTLEAIAKRTGFAKASVGYILRGQTAAFSPATVLAVQEAATALGYRPNAAARAMSTRRFGQVGLLLSAGARRSLISNELLIALTEQLAAHQVSLVVSVCDDARLVDPAYVPNILRDLMVDGLISAYSYQVPAGMAELLERHHLPCVWINVKRQLDAVYPNDFTAALTATEYLLQHGHRHIAYVDYDIGVTTPEIYRHYSMADRFAGYGTAMKAANCTPRRFTHEDRLADTERLGACRQWLRPADRPTAVIAYGAVSARSVVAAALLEGLNIPVDLSIITFGNGPVDDFAILLDTMVIDERAMAAHSVELLLRRIAQPLVETPSQAVDLRRIAGHSTAPRK